MASEPRELSLLDARPCPFCGDQPEIEPWHGGGKMKRRIGCNRDSCFVGPSVCGSTPKQALNLWNYRVEARDARR